MPEEEKPAPDKDAELKGKFKVGGAKAPEKEKVGAKVGAANQAAVDDFVNNFVPKLAQEYVHSFVLVNLPDGYAVLVPFDPKGSSRVALTLDEKAKAQLREQLNAPKATP